MKLLPSYFGIKQQLSQIFFGRWRQAFKPDHPHQNRTQDEVAAIYQELLRENDALTLLDLQTKTFSLPVVENVFITQAGILVFFHQSNQDEVQVYSLLFEAAEPRRLLWKVPRLIVQFANRGANWQFIKLERVAGRYESTWKSRTFGTQIKIYPTYRVTQEIRIKHRLPVLHKSKLNPLIKPQIDNSWEAFTTFNPAAFYAADKIHILYRAQGHDYVSQLGYATSSDGHTIDFRHDQPIYQPRQTFEGWSLPPGEPNGEFVSGGGCGGVEDPRTTVIGDRIYMTYVAYNGWSEPRIAITSIALTDFLDHNFLWEKPVLISPPGVVDKSACVFPDKVNGKFVIMHRVFPNILIDYVDNLNFDGQTFLTGQHKLEPRSRDWWDSRKIGAGAPPLKTNEGWLLIYQAVDDKNASEYQVGAMLLDLNDPSRILYRSQEPILLPREDYENYGFKAGVVYPCGAIIKDGTLFVYYGGADSYVCVAVADLDSFLYDLKKTGINQLDPTMLQKKR